MTFTFNILIGYQKTIMTFTFTLNALIGQLNSHTIKSLAYLTNSECLLCSSHHGPLLTKYGSTVRGCKGGSAQGYDSTRVGGGAHGWEVQVQEGIKVAGCKSRRAQGLVRLHPFTCSPSCPRTR